MKTINIQKQSFMFWTEISFHLGANIFLFDHIPLCKWHESIEIYSENPNNFQIFTQTL
jgi:hypothetical protein